MVRGWGGEELIINKNDPTRRLGKSAVQSWLERRPRSKISRRPCQRGRSIQVFDRRKAPVLVFATRIRLCREFSARFRLSVDKPMRAAVVTFNFSSRSNLAYRSSAHFLPLYTLCYPFA